MTCNHIFLGIRIISVFKDLIFSNKVFYEYRKRRTTFNIGLIILLITKKHGLRTPSEEINERNLKI
jgi:hypothetical protein